MLRRHLNSTAGETVGPTDNAIVDRTYSLQAVHTSVGETVDICTCVDVTLILTRVRKNHDKRAVNTEQ